MPVKVYEAMLAHPASVARVVAARPAIERAGGSVKFAPPTASGMVLVTLILPDQFIPENSCLGFRFTPCDGYWRACSPARSLLTPPPPWERGMGVRFAALHLRPLAHWNELQPLWANVF